MSKKGYGTIATDGDDETNQPSHPMQSANFLSFLTFWWMNGIFEIESKRPLNQSDFLPLHEKDRTGDLTERLQREWNHHLRECNSTEGKEPKLWKSMLKMISWKEILYLMSFYFIESVCRVLQPLVLGWLLHLLSSTEVDRSLTYACCLLLSLGGLSSACRHYPAYRFELIGMRLSSALKGIVYLKVRVQDAFLLTYNIHERRLHLFR